MLARDVASPINKMLDRFINRRLTHSYKTAPQCLFHHNIQYLVIVKALKSANNKVLMHRIFYPDSGLALI